MHRRSYPPPLILCAVDARSLWGRRTICIRAHAVRPLPSLEPPLERFHLFENQKQAFWVKEVATCGPSQKRCARPPLAKCRGRPCA